MGIIWKKSTEQKEQIKFVQFMRTFMPEIIVASIPNGAATTSANRIKLRNEGLLAGMPDIMVIAPDKILFLEFKRPDGKGRVSLEQESVLQKLKDMNHAAHVVESDYEARQLVATWLG